MGAEVGESDERWEFNYFNYFTEVEEHFQKARGTGLFLLSPVDWALIECWKDAGVPLEAVLRGIDAAFEKRRARKRRGREVNSLAWCAQAVIEQAQILAGALPPASGLQTAPPFSLDELRSFLSANASRLDALADYAGIAVTLRELHEQADTHYSNLEDLERRLAALEDRMIGLARSQQSDEAVLASRRELDLELRPYRARMTAEQLAMLERQYLDRRLLDQAGLPRLSLFYLR